MIRSFLLTLILLTFSSLLSIAQEPAKLGIFDATADWGLEPDFPPKLGIYKVPGRVEVSGEGDNLVYNLFGNGNGGDGLDGRSDEGFYLYKKSYGSTQISGFVKWIEIGGMPSPGYPEFWLTIREDAINAGSKRYCVVYGVMEDDPYVYYLHPEWRGQSNSRINRYILSHRVSRQLQGLYLRMTYLIPKNLIIAEYSEDGELWKLSHHINMDMGEHPVLGLAITNYMDNELLSHVQVSNVEINPAPPAAIRTIKPGYFKPGESHTVELEIFNPQEISQDISLHEIPPPGWSIDEVDHEGIIENGKLVCNFSAKPGSTLLHYTVTAATDTIKSVTFSGTIGNQSIIGDSQIFSATTPVKTLEKIHWTTWGNEEGFTYLDYRFFTLNPNNTIISDCNNNNFAIMDSYSIQQIPLPENGRNLYIPHTWYIMQNTAGQIWSASYDRFGIAGNLTTYGFHQYIDGVWKYYPMDFDIIQENIGITAISIEKNILLLSTPDHILEFNATDLSTRTILSATDVKMDKFESMVWNHGQGAWIMGNKGAISLVENDKSSTNWEWQVFPFGFQIEDYAALTPYMGPNGNLFCRLIDVLTIGGDIKVTLLSLNGKTWQPIMEFPYVATEFIDSDGVAWFNNVKNYTLMRSIHARKEIVVDNYGNPLKVNHIEAGMEGDIWISTNNGIARHAPQLWRTPTDIGNFNQPIFAIQEDVEGRIWFLSFDYLIGYVNQEFVFYPLPLESKRTGITSTVFDWNQLSTFPKLVTLHNGNSVITSHNVLGDRYYSYLWEWNPYEIRWQFINQVIPVHDVGQGNNGKTIVRSSDNQIFEYDGQEFKLRNSIQERITESRQITFETTTGELWFGVGEILRRIHAEQEITYGPEQGYSGGTAQCMLELDNGILWIGTLTGIEQFDGNHFQPIQTNIGSVYSMIQSKDGNVWVATENGIYRHQNGTWISYSSEDGLPSSSFFTIYEDRQGRIWAGAANGIVYYDPSADPDPPQTYIDEEAQLYQHGLPVRIRYHGMDKWKYTDSSRLLYSISFDGDPWSEYQSNTEFVISHLPPGQHRFEVRAMDRNWNIDPTPAVFEFRVLKPWYLETVFLIILVIATLLILLFAGVALRRHLQLAHSNDQLNQANKELLELDKMKSAFVSQASHDLRTPLTAIKSSLDNVIRGVGGGLNEKQNDVIGRALKSVDRLTLLINDILDINRIESGREVLHKEYVLFDVLAKNTVMENLPAASQKNISISTTGLDISCHLLIDPGKIERVVGELIGNAIKYTPDGGRVEISLSKDNQSVFLTVEDSGIGMTEEECKKIWERFYRTDASKTFAKGSGLGLSIAKELVEMHGGRIKVISEVNKGTTFILILPNGGKDCV